MQKSSTRQLTMPDPFNPKKNSGALGYPFYARRPVEFSRYPQLLWAEVNIMA